MCRPTTLTKTNSSAPSDDPDHKKDDIQAIHPKVATTPSGVEKRKFLIELGVLSLSVIYGSVKYLNPNIPVNPHLCEGESSEDGCLRPDLTAYKVTSLVAMSTMGLMGIYNWHVNAQVRQLAHASPEERLFGHSNAADYQNVVILVYQIWDFVVSFTIPENMDPIFLVHHVLAMITAYCSLEYQMVPYYSIFYGGCSEFSSIFLIFLDKDQIFPITPGSLMDQWVLVCKGMFFLTFSYYRIFGWIYNSFPLWKDISAVIESGAVEQHRPGKTYFLRLFQGLDLVLGALQCYWYYEILKTVAALLK